MSLDNSAYDNAYSSRRSAFLNKARLIEIALFLESIGQTCQFQTRVESSSLCVFTNDETLVDTIQKEFSDLVQGIWKPENEDMAMYLTSNNRKVICNELPNGLYRFKVYLNSSNKIPANLKESFLVWADKHGEKRVGLTRSTREFFENKMIYSYGQYFYTSDDKMLSMALMFIGQFVNKTEEFVVKEQVV